MERDKFNSDAGQSRDCGRYRPINVLTMTTAEDGVAAVMPWRFRYSGMMVTRYRYVARSAIMADLLALSFCLEKRWPRGRDRSVDAALAKYLYFLGLETMPLSARRPFTRNDHAILGDIIANIIFLPPDADFAHCRYIAVVWRYK